MTGGNAAAGFMATVVVGGTVSELSGGKFANGAKTAAYQFLFNQMSSRVKALAKEMFQDARDRRQQLQEWISTNNVDEIKNAYPAFSTLSDQNVIISARSASNDFYGLAMQRMLPTFELAAEEFAARTLSAGAEIIKSPNMKGGGWAIYEFFTYEPAPLPFRHQWVVDRIGRVDYEFVPR